MSSFITRDNSTVVWYVNADFQLNGDVTPSSASSGCGSETSRRLNAVLLDYKQFLAARTIQRSVRSWLLRRNFRKQNQAATTIAKWWRGFDVRNKRYALIEADLQGRLLKYYHDMATKTQSLFRAWQTRMKCQDFQGMKQLRMQYAEDMLSTLVKCLRKVKKAHMLPGIYGLRENVLLHKIEGLCLTFGYRFHNGRMRAAIAQRRAMLAQRRSDFRRTVLYTPAPFPEPDSVLTQATDLCIGKTIGSQHQRVFLLYDKSNRDRHVKDILQKVSARLRNTMAMHRQHIRKRFCKDFIRRTLRKTLNLPRHKRHSGLIKQFIEELQEKNDVYNCYCRPKDPDNAWCV